jgi:hypothetical protein
MWVNQQLCTTTLTALKESIKKETCEVAVRFCTKTSHQRTKRLVCSFVWLKNAYCLLFTKMRLTFTA